MFVNDREYEVIRALPEGKGGRSWIVTDGRKRYVLKEADSDLRSPREMTMATSRGYERLRKTGIRMPELVDVDYERNRILKEYIEGDNAFELVLKKGLDNSIIVQVYEMSEKAESAGFNIDYFPTNFVLKDGSLYYVDYDVDPYTEEWNLENWGIQYWSHTPELELYLDEYGTGQNQTEM